MLHIRALQQTVVILGKNYNYFILMRNFFFFLQVGLMFHRFTYIVVRRVYIKIVYSLLMNKSMIYPFHIEEITQTSFKKKFDKNSEQIRQCRQCPLKSF